jgi:alpha-1,3-mannosyltransferase
MNAVLYFPGLMVVITVVSGLEGSIRAVVRILQIQVLLAIPFRTHARSYITKAFDLGRAFLWKWTVNWRFVGEDIFLSRKFAWGLLVGHFTVLLLFLSSRWLRYVPVQGQH